LVVQAGGLEPHRLQSRAIDDYDPLATPEENMVALAPRSGALATSLGQAGRRAGLVMIEHSNTGLTELDPTFFSADSRAHECPLSAVKRTLRRAVAT
jgi:hypothetical protein